MFVYVMDEPSMQLLSERNYTLMHADSKNMIWCFEVPADDEVPCPHVRSNLFVFDEI